MSEVEITFRRNKTIYSNTGWYGCIDPNIEIQELSLNSTNWKYIFVRCKKSQNHCQTVMYITWSLNLKNSVLAKKNPFVDGRKSIRVSRSKALTLPCRPTAPEYQVTLQYDGEVNHIDYFQREN